MKKVKDELRNKILARIKELKEEKVGLTRSLMGHRMERIQFEIRILETILS